MIALIQLLWPTCFHMVFLNISKDLSIIFELLKNVQIIFKTNIYTQTIKHILLTIICSKLQGIIKRFSVGSLMNDVSRKN